jgi:hypothetical protein
VAVQDPLVRRGVALRQVRDEVSIIDAQGRLLRIGSDRKSKSVQCGSYRLPGISLDNDHRADILVGLNWGSITTDMTGPVPGGITLTARRVPGQCMTTRQHAFLVSEWIAKIGLDRTCSRPIRFGEPGRYSFIVGAEPNRLISTSIVAAAACGP